MPKFFKFESNRPSAKESSEPSIDWDSLTEEQYSIDEIDPSPTPRKSYESRNETPTKPKDALSDADLAILGRKGIHPTEAQSEEIARKVRLIASTKRKVDIQSGKIKYQSKEVAEMLSRYTPEEEKFMEEYIEAMETNNFPFELHQAFILTAYHRQEEEDRRKTEELLKKGADKIISNYPEYAKARRNEMRSIAGLPPEEDTPPAAQPDNQKPKSGGFFSRFRK